jgi:hypothetical protein
VTQASPFLASELLAGCIGIPTIAYLVVLRRDVAGD